MVVVGKGCGNTAVEPCDKITWKIRTRCNVLHVSGHKHNKEQEIATKKNT